MRTPFQVVTTLKRYKMDAVTRLWNFATQTEQEQFAAETQRKHGGGIKVELKSYA